jgi:hypothetical protein
MGESAHDVAVKITEEKKTNPTLKRTTDLFISTSPWAI